MLMALAGQRGGPDDQRPRDAFEAMHVAFGWERVAPHDTLYARFGLKVPRENERGVIVFDRADGSVA